MLTKGVRHQPTIPAAVLAQIVQHRPHLATIAANVRSGAVPERALAVAYLAGATELSAVDTLHSGTGCPRRPVGRRLGHHGHGCCPCGGHDGRIRQKALSGELESIKRGGVPYVRRAKGKSPVPHAPLSSGRGFAMSPAASAGRTGRYYLAVPSGVIFVRTNRCITVDTANEDRRRAHVWHVVAVQK